MYIVKLVGKTKCFTHPLLLQHNTDGVERLEVLVRQQESLGEPLVVWSLPYYEEADKPLWMKGRVEIRVPEDPNYLYRVSLKIFLNSVKHNLAHKSTLAEIIFSNFLVNFLIKQYQVIFYKCDA